MTSHSRRHRLLFVHAHPDDETLATGVAMAHYARAGHMVHLLTCTQGEEGEVIPADLRHLAADTEDRLGPYRRQELAAAMRWLSVPHEFLGAGAGAGAFGSAGAATYRDSGMAGTSSATRPEAFSNADRWQVAASVHEVVRRLSPDVVVTYDEYGGYRHPDHIATHRAVVDALATTAAERRPELFAVVTARSWAEADRSWAREQVPAALLADGRVLLPEPDEPFPPNVVDDDVLTHVVTGTAADLRARDAALREHRTQVAVYDGFYTLSNRIAARLTVREGYLRLDPTTGRPGPSVAAAIASPSEKPAARAVRGLFGEGG